MGKGGRGKGGGEGTGGTAIYHYSFVSLGALALHASIYSTQYEPSGWRRAASAAPLFNTTSSHGADAYQLLANMRIATLYSPPGNANLLLAARAVGGVVVVVAGRCRDQVIQAALAFGSRHRHTRGLKRPRTSLPDTEVKGFTHPWGIRKGTAIKGRSTP